MVAIPPPIPERNPMRNSKENRNAVFFPHGAILPISSDCQQQRDIQQETYERKVPDLQKESGHGQDPGNGEHSDEEELPGPACEAFFQDQKLVEMVFLQFNMRELLLLIQTISKTWYSIIADSECLQQALFFKPITSRPLTYVKPRGSIEAEKIVSRSKSVAQLPLVGTSTTRKAHSFPLEKSSSPATPYQTQHMTSALEGAFPTHQRTPSCDLPEGPMSTKTVTESSSSGNLFRKFTKKHKKTKKFDKPTTSNNSSSVSLSIDIPRPSLEFRRDSDNWTPRFYPLTQERDLRQQIFEHPFISRNDAPTKKYSIPLYIGRRNASWRKQFLTQPPMASIKVLSDHHAEKVDLVVYARDGIGVRLGDVADALGLRGMVFLHYEGREWWRPWAYTTVRAGEFLEYFERGVGDGAWSLIGEDEVW
ncbi:hypothetical protein PRZ48_008272 [Zasmidium cellare]|uniref:F-box domain-containing protein n=1 Tax=Zasmidium cellare TaxID=395010 RepID=A0ABR0EF01_ZASCE|nr:hypothetical protein PRZ48_008272 [Zasmidium cellare]